MTGQADYTYDLFISYTEADRAWVQGYLLPGLGLPPERVIIPQDFRLGAPVVTEFERAVTDSRYTVLVLSPAYLADEWATFGELLVSHTSVAEQRDRLIPLFLQPCTLPLRVDFRVRLDCTDEISWERETARLRALVDQPEPAPERIPCPYPGMVPFSAEDARFFYGRDAEVQQMLHHLRYQRCLFIIGPSGCGKSSLALAGLLPKLVQSNYFPQGFWLVREMRPGGQPLPALVQAIGGAPGQPTQVLADLLAAHPPAQRLLLAIDQFEELFTQTERAEQSRFIAALQALRTVETCALLIAMRADFYPDLMNSDLWPVHPSQRLEIAPPRGEALRQAIQRPAADVGVHLEAGLLERLLADAADEPGVLPMLQETLVLLWGEKQRRLLPLSAYERLGSEGRSGLAVAVSTKADATLADLSDEQKTIARRIFLRLVQFGEGRPDTCRQQPVAALHAAGDEPHLFEQTLRHLTDNRLLTLSGEEEDPDRQADIAHEALIAGWPTLQDWVADRREAEQTRRRLEARVADWMRLGRGSGGLLDEVELLETEHWMTSRDADDLGYGDTLPALVEASRAAIEKVERAKEAARQRELKRAHALVEEQRLRAEAEERRAEEERLRAEAEERRAEEQAQAARRLLMRNRAIMVVGIMTLVMAVFALWFGVRERQQSRVALSSALAAHAQAALDQYPQRSLLLAIEARNAAHIPVAEEALLRALANPSGRGLGSHGGAVTTVAISADNHWAVAGSTDGTVHMWDLTTQDPATTTTVMHSSGGSVTAIAISSDGRWLVAGSANGVAYLWNLAASEPITASIALQGHEDSITAAAISPDNHWLITGSDDETTRLWNLNDLTTTPIILQDHRSFITTITVSPDGHWLVTGSTSGAVRLWDLTALDSASESIVLHGHENSITTTAVSSDSRWLVTGSSDGTVYWWHLDVVGSSMMPIALGGHKDSITAVAITSDNHWLVTCSKDGTSRLWDLTDSNPVANPVVVLDHEGTVTSIALSPNNRWLVTGSDDNNVRLWDLIEQDSSTNPVILRGHEGPITSVAVSSDSHWLVTGSGDNTARLWDLTNPRSFAISYVVLRGHSGGITDLTVSHDGNWLVSGDTAGTVGLYDLSTSSNALSLSLRAHIGRVVFVSLSNDNRWMVTCGSLDDTLWPTEARLWDLTASDPAAEPITINNLPRFRIDAIALSPDNHWLAVAIDDSMDLAGFSGTWSTIQLRDLDSSDQPLVLNELPGRDGTIIGSLGISLDKRWFAAGCGGEVYPEYSGQFGVIVKPCQSQLWDLSARNPMPIALPERTNRIAFSPDNRWLVAGNARLPELHSKFPSEPVVMLWNLSPTGLSTEPVVLPDYEGYITHFAISPDSHWLAAVGSDSTVHLWELTNPSSKPVSLHGHEGSITDIAISSDSRWLITGGEDATVRRWDLMNPTKPPIVFQDHSGTVSAVAVSPDSHWLISGSEDTTIRLRSSWQEETIDLPDLACRMAGRNLTRNEWRQYLSNQDYRQTCQQWLSDTDYVYTEGSLFWRKHGRTLTTLGAALLLFVAFILMFFLVLLVRYYVEYPPWRR